MAELVFYDQRNFSHPKYYRIIQAYDRDIHPKLEEKFFRDKKLLEEERLKAEIMTKYFTFLKNALVLGEKKGAVVFPDELLNRLRNRGIFGLSEYIKHYSGEAFEKDLVAVINAVASQREGARQIAANRIGNYTAAADVFLAIVDDINKDANQFISKADVAIVNHKSVPGVTHRLSKRQGLIDVRVNKSSSNLEFSVDMPDLDKFYWALDGAQFSAKNYLLKTIVEHGVHLGNANNLRKISSALNFVLDNPDYRDVQKVFFASMKTKDQQVAPHLKHLAAIYELAGAGQIYYKKDKRYDFGIANYLIINENSAFAPIKVFSIRALIQDFVMGSSNYGSKVSVGKTGVVFKMDQL